MTLGQMSRESIFQLGKEGKKGDCREVQDVGFAEHHILIDFP